MLQPNLQTIGMDENSIDLFPTFFRTLSSLCAEIPSKLRNNFRCKLSLFRLMEIPKFDAMVIHPLDLAHIYNMQKSCKINRLHNFIRFQIVKSIL